MAWIGPSGTLNPGVAAKWFYAWNGYNGAQIATIRALTSGSEIVVEEQSQKLESDGGYVYYVRFRNIGPFPVQFQLTGGAL